MLLGKKGQSNAKQSTEIHTLQRSVNKYKAMLFVLQIQSITSRATLTPKAVHCLSFLSVYCRIPTHTLKE